MHCTRAGGSPYLVKTILRYDKTPTTPSRAFQEAKGGGSSRRNKKRISRGESEGGVAVQSDLLHRSAPLILHASPQLCTALPRPRRAVGLHTGERIQGRANTLMYQGRWMW